MGVTQGLLRFSIGLEDADDLANDFTNALKN
jgi:cystathionine beta-lyase/cystathionine gamma-synthase